MTSRTKINRRTRLLVLVAVALTLAIASTSALAATSYSLALSAPPSGTVGTAIAITASGTDVVGPYNSAYLDLDAIPTTLTSTCPADYSNADQLASTAPGGAWIAGSEVESYDPSGNFSNTNAWTPTVPGTFLLCGYTNDALTHTLSTASTTIIIATTTPTVTPPPASTTKPPANTARPRVTRAGATLRCRVGAWTNGPVSYGYRWLVAGKVKKGANGATLRRTRKLRGRRVRCTVTASNSAGSASATSAAFKVH